jgi:uncharacterized protein YggU (UPF0235/DUF167 family)
VDLAEALRDHPEGASLRVRAVPGARATEVAGLHAGALRVRVAAPPVEGKANAVLLAFLAGRLGLRPRDLSVAAGASARDKLVIIRGRTAEQVRAALEPATRHPRS